MDYHLKVKNNFRQGPAGGSPGGHGRPSVPTGWPKNTKPRSLDLRYGACCLWRLSPEGGALTGILACPFGFAQVFPQHLPLEGRLDPVRFSSLFHISSVLFLDLGMAEHRRRRFWGKAGENLRPF
jgi:hypothetical protein